MKLYIMKKETLETLKSNLSVVYGKYYTEKTNDWIIDICGENPFILFKEITDFELASLELTPGEIDFNNCKILYKKLQFLTESQASDERLWAGLTHTTFYEYMRKRWKYGYGKQPEEIEKEVGAIKTRFFYKSTGRSGFYRNTLAKCWWVGHNIYNPKNVKNPFESLDIIGSNDLNSKINELFYNFTFSSNPHIMSAIIESLRRFREEGRYISVREHIRPAMSYLNAVGGSIVIDCLEKDQIIKIFSDAINSMIKGDTPLLNLEKSEIDVNDSADYSDGKNNDTIIEDDRLEVVLGCKVIIKNKKNETKTYKYDFQKGKLPKNLAVFTGRKVGDIVEMNGTMWRIENIRF